MVKKPIILSVDDEIEVSNAIERDLRSHYGKEYKIIKTNSGSEALETVPKRSAYAGNGRN
jgi:thioredoxin reductase (NADPH)